MNTPMVGNIEKMISKNPIATSVYIGILSFIVIKL